MKTENIQSRVDQIARGYSRCGFYKLGALTIAKNNPTPRSTVPPARLRESASLLTGGYIMEMRRDVEEISAWAVSAAIKDAERDLGIQLNIIFTGTLLTDLDEFISGEREGLVESLARQAMTDQSAMKRYQRQFALEVQMIAFSSESSVASAQRVVATKKQSPERIYLDRSGKHWKAERFVRVATMSHLFKMYNEVYLYAMTMRDRNIAEVVMPDASHRSHGMLFTIGSPEEGIPSYHDIRKEVFHPNSLALVVAK